MPEFVIGRGGMTIAQVGGSSDSPPLKRFRYDVLSSGIQFYSLNVPGLAVAPDSFIQGSFFDLVASLGPLNPVANTPGFIIRDAYLSLATLPASPRDAFGQVSFSLDAAGTAVALNVLQSEVFGVSKNGYTAFKDLDLTISHHQTALAIQVSGGVNTQILEQEIFLDVALTESALVFTRKTSDNQIILDQLGQLTIDSLSVSPGPEYQPWNDLQTLYTFEERDGDTIFDVAGVSANPLDLKIRTLPDGSLDKATWHPGYLTTQSGSFISSTHTTGEFHSTAALIAACQSTNEITIAAWIKPESVDQNERSSQNPARIVTLSKSPSARNFTLAQDRDTYVGRLRTTDTGGNGTKPELRAVNAVDSDLTYVVYTRAVDKSDDNASPQNKKRPRGTARLYINGVEVDAAREDLDGTFSTWDSFELALANEFGEPPDRPWAGDYHRIAIYSRALTSADIAHSYFPHVSDVAGEISLVEVPDPLSQSLSAVLKHGGETVVLTIADQRPRSVTPQLSFDTIDLTWARETVSTSWSLTSGNINAQLWGNPLSFETTEKEGVRFLPLVTTPGKTIELLLPGIEHSAANQTSLGSVSFSDLVLEPRADGRTWHLNADPKMTEVIVPPPLYGRPFDYRIDFRLLEPALAIEEGRVVLTGQWLGEQIALYGLDQGNQFILQGQVRFDLLFSLSLGPIYEPGTAIQVLDQVQVCQTSGCRQTMTADVSIDLSGTGFLALVNGSFIWEDATLSEHPLTVPQFSLLRLPTTPNDILQALLAELRANANEIFSPAAQNQADYFFSQQGGGPLMLAYGQSPASRTATTTIETDLPPVFSQDGSVVGQVAATEIFNLTQADNRSQLTMAMAGQSAADIKTAYGSFLTALADQMLLPGADQVIQRRIAERLSVPLDEVLFYHYGFEPAQNYLDLSGGMRLRVDYQNYQFVHPSDRTANTGFVGSGSAYYTINSYFSAQANGYLLGFDSFLPQLVTEASTDIARVGAGGAIELLQPEYRQAYLRLFYPSQFSGSGGSRGVQQVVTLVAAGSRAELEVATTEYSQAGQVNSVAHFHFRGRATVIPEIVVFVQEQPVYVAVGTTMRQLAERYLSLPTRVNRGNLGDFQGRIRPRRLVHEGIENRPDYRFINFPDGPSSGGMDAFDLPLVKGDRFYF